MLAGQRPGQGVAEQGLRSLALQRAEADDHESRIGDVLDNLIHQAQVSCWGGEERGEAKPIRRDLTSRGRCGRSAWSQDDDRQLSEKQAGWPEDRQIVPVCPV